MKKKVTMKTAVPSSQSTPPTAVRSQRTRRRSIIGQIFELITQDHPPKSNLARAVSEPPVKPRPVPIVSKDEAIYNHYSAYCAYVGITPRSIEAWDLLRDSQKATGRDELRSKRLVRDVQSAKSQPAVTEISQPGCLKRPTERPLTLDTHVSRSAYRPSLLDVNKRDMAPFEYRNFTEVKSVVNRRFRTTTILEQSKWCSDCIEYVSQSHECTPPPSKPCSVGPYRNSLLEQKARQLLLADKQRREHERLECAAQFNLTTPVAHKLAWIRSFGGVFSHAMRRISSPADLVVARNLAVSDLPLNQFFAPQRSRDIYPIAKASCKHTSIRSFTFSTGEIITLCHDCGKATGHEVLKVVNIFAPPWSIGR